jgi:hypothetical protein
LCLGRQQLGQVLNGARAGGVLNSIIGIHPAWAELDGTGIPFTVKPQLVATHSGNDINDIGSLLAHFRKGPLWPASGSKLLTSVDDVSAVIAPDQQERGLVGPADRVLRRLLAVLAG